MRNINSLLKLAVHQFTSKYDHQEDIDKLQQSLGSYQIQLPDTRAECQQLYKEHLKLFKEVINKERQTGQLRKTHQKDLISKYEEEGDKEKAKRIRRLMRAEATARVFRKCAAARGKVNEGGLSHVLVPTTPGADPKTCTDWTRVDDPEALTQILTDRNQKHFGQAKNCTWTSPPLDVTMEFEGTCEKADRILTGTYDTSDLNEATQWLIDNLQHVTALDSVDHTLTKEEFEGKIKAWNERTSTSPKSNVHLGHAKAYFAPHLLHPKKPETRELEETRERILEGHLTLLNYALKFGYSFTRWQTIVNAMLEKDPGEPKIHRLRVIHLYEYDFNLILCVKWRQLLHHACDHHLIDPNCYGSLPGKSALDAVLTKELEWEIHRLTRKALIQFDNDAASCYDRIPCFLANVASRKYGMSRHVCIVQGRTLKEAKYHLKTKLGISEEYVTHSFLAPWFGTGQGSGNSPMYWLVISSTLFDVYTDKAQGVLYSDPIGDLTIKLHILGFVDDTNNRTGNFLCHPQPPMSTLIAEASKDSQLWHDLLAASNQALELSKCKYHAIHFKFQSSGEPFMVEEAQPPAPLQINNSAGQPVTIKHISSSTANRYLGCYNAPRSNSTQAKILKDKCDDFARVINCSSLTRHDTSIFYRAIYNLSVGYPLPTCYFSFAELDRIQSKAHRAFVSNCGYNRHTAKEIIYGPHCLGGAAFFHLYDIQGFGQVQHFLKFWRRPKSPQGTLFRILMAWAQFCTGIGVPILEDTKHPPLPHMELKWIASLRRYLADVDGSIHLDNPRIPQLQRQHDSYIMEKVLTYTPALKPKMIKRINYCRMYLSVVTVSDIATASGTHIDEAMYRGDRDSLSSSYTGHPVEQRRPDAKSWKAWRKACRMFCGGPSNLKLMQPLGNWTRPAQELRRSWNHWYDPPSDTLFHKATYGTYNKHQRLQMDFDQEPHSTTDTLPPTAIPATIKDHTTTWSLVHSTASWELPPQPPPASLLIEHIQMLPQWEHELFDNLQLSCPEQTLISAVTNNHFYLASDGSAQGYKASFAWVLSTTDGTRLATCSGPAFGAKPNSYHAEGYGILSCCRLLHHINKISQHGPTHSFTLLCDNLSMVNKSNALPKNMDDIHPNDTMEAEWDILAEIWTTLLSLPETSRPSIQHIKGHQDDKKPYAELPLPAQLNCDADKLADQYITAFPNKDYSWVPLLPASGAQLNLPSGTITFKHKRELRLARTSKPLEEKMMLRNQWDPDTFNNIDWEAYRRGLNRHDKQRSTLIKYHHRILPVGKQVSKYDKKYSPSCPTCQDPIETQDHLHLCPHTTREEWRTSFMKTLMNKLDKIDTDPQLLDLMREGLHSVLFPHRHPDNAIKVPTGYEDLAANQADIGWSQILKGKLSIDWQIRQQAYLGDKSTKKKNGQTWTTDVVSTIFEQWLNLWNLRNTDRHGRDQASKAQAENLQAIRELYQLYDLKDYQPPELQWILAPPIIERLRWPTYAIRAFINSFQPILSKGYTDALATG